MSTDSNTSVKNKHDEHDNHSNNAIDDNKLTRDSIKRLVKDISDLYKNPLTDSSIYYIHDEENIQLGYALIVGPDDTPYENGLYFFKLLFPRDYPFSPPKVTTLTNDGHCRFHPNLYRCGKVCLSLLNTWKGEGWTSCQNIKSVLLTIQSVMDSNPLLHEPGITSSNRDISIYNDALRYTNISFSIITMLDSIILKKRFSHAFMVFSDILENMYREKRDVLDTYIKTYITSEKSNPISFMQHEIPVTTYNMCIKVNIAELDKRWKNIMSKLDKQIGIEIKQ